MKSQTDDQIHCMCLYIGFHTTQLRKGFSTGNARAALQVVGTSVFPEVFRFASVKLSVLLESRAVKAIQQLHRVRTLNATQRKYRITALTFKLFPTGCYRNVESEIQVLLPFFYQLALHLLQSHSKMNAPDLSLK